VYTANLNEEGAVDAFQLSLVDRGELTVRRQADSWQGYWREFERVEVLRTLRGTLNGALEASLRSSGGSPRLSYAMAEALQWDLDFNRDLRAGDEFEVVYEQVFLDDVDRGPGRVFALTYTNQGSRFEAYRFGNDGGFYDAEGRPLRKMFLRSPLQYSARITSGFSHSRFHPVLKKRRPHYGVDYGAPVGTPVRVTAGGVVLSASWSGGGGKTVKIRHTNEYETAYLHLSRYAKGIRKGKRVQQGEVVGFVGSTGLATGPHLDYRVRHRGQWINPLKLTSVPARPIPQRDLPDFLAWRDRMRECLATGQPPRPYEIARALDRTSNPDLERAPESPSSDEPSSLAR
jgi:murein DD-endopeptidase MepM/ murein hydrolase activator NlpD